MVVRPAGRSVVATMADLKWTDDDLRLAVELAWQAGRDYEPPGLAEALDDARHATPDPPRKSYEERVAERVALFEQCAERIRAELSAARGEKLSHVQPTMGDAGAAGAQNHEAARLVAA